MGIKESHMNISIDRTSSIPLHKQVEMLLKKLITDNYFESCDYQITEKDLQEQLGVSRNTVRHAVSKLADQGLLTKERARGILLLPDSSKIISESVNGLSFTESAIKRGQNPTAKLLNFEKLKATDKISSALSLKRDKNIFHVRRIRYLDNHPACITDSYIPVLIAPKLSADDFTENGENQSLYFILERKHDLPILMWVESLEAVKISKNNSSILNVPSESPGILRKDIIYSLNKKIIAYNITLTTNKYQIRGLVYKRERL